MKIFFALWTQICRGKDDFFVYSQPDRANLL